MRTKKKSTPLATSWLDTYADMVTLLLTFFILLFAMSSVDAGKWDMLVKAFAGELRPGATKQIVIVDPNETSSVVSESVIVAEPVSSSEEINTNPKEVHEFDELYYYLKNYIEKNDMEDIVSVHKGEEYTFIIFRNNVFFDGDSAVLRASGKTILNFLADGLVNITDEIGEVRFYGHTAHFGNSTEIAHVTFDRQLSVNRATNVLLHIQLKNILDPKKLISEGYGEFRPLVPDDGTEATRVKNRRVEICISKSNSVSATLDAIYEKIESEP